MAQVLRIAVVLLPLAAYVVLKIFPRLLQDPYFKMAEHLIGSIQDLRSKCEPYDSAFDPFKNKHKKLPSYRVDRALGALANVLVSEKSEVLPLWRA